MDDSTYPAVLELAQAEVAGLVTGLIAAGELDLGAAERTVRDGMLAVGARRLEAGLAARGTGKVGPTQPCPCGAVATCEGYRRKEVQTLVGWIEVRRAYYWCAACGRGWCPLDATLGVGRDSHRPGVRRALSRLGARLPFVQAADTLAEVAGLQTSASTVRAVTAAVGARREAELADAATTAWRDGLPPTDAPAPARLYVAMDGVRIMGEDGEGKEAKVGVVRPEHRPAGGNLAPAAASYAASFAPAAVFGQRLALEAHRRGLEAAAEVVVLGDGAEWIWNLAAEHFPAASQIVDWYHASEHIWALARALYGEGTPRATAWAERQLARLAQGEVRGMVGAWRRLKCHGAATAVRDEQVTYFTNQAGRMAYDRYRARGLDIGSGMVESACKLVIGAREKGPGRRWSVPGAEAVAHVRVLLCNDQWATYRLTA
jgi:hypothetical protein